MYHLLALALAPLLYPSSVHAIQRGCSVANAKLQLPTGLVLQPNTVAVSIVEGLGTQNYTCSSSGTYTGQGSFAEMYDLSCLVAEAVAQGVSYQSINGLTWKRDANYDLLDDNLRIGCYYFIPDPTDPHNATKNIPDFDWNCDNKGILAGDPNGFMLGQKFAAVPAPSPANSTFDIPWVVVKGVSGDLASWVYRVNTHGGQPPAKCQPGSPDIAIPYSAMYWLFQNESAYHPFGASTSTTTTTITTTIDHGTTAYYAPSPASLSSTYLHWSSSTPAPTYAKAAELNAAVSSDSNASSSDSDDDKLNKLLKYAPVAIGLLGLATVLSLIALVVSFVYMCRRRGGSIPSRTVVPAYHPIQLPRSSQHVMAESYHDETKPYDP